MKIFVAIFVVLLLIVFILLCTVELGMADRAAKLAGLIDWYSITDRTRNLRSNGHWDKPSEVIESAKYSYLFERTV